MKTDTMARQNLWLKDKVEALNLQIEMMNKTWTDKSMMYDSLWEQQSDLNLQNVGLWETQLEINQNFLDLFELLIYD